MTRLSELAAKAAADLYDGIPPLGGEFLADNEVTLDEAYDLADRIANAIVVSEYLLREQPNEWAMAFAMGNLTARSKVTNK